MELSFIVSRMVDNQERFDIDKEVDASFQDANYAFFAADASAQTSHVRHIAIHLGEGLLALGLTESVVASLC